MRFHENVTHLAETDLIKNFVAKHGFKVMLHTDHNGTILVLFKLPFVITIVNDITEETLDVLFYDLKNKFFATASAIGWLLVEKGWLISKHISTINFNEYPNYPFLNRASPYMNYAIYKDMVRMDTFFSHMSSPPELLYSNLLTYSVPDIKINEINGWLGQSFS